MEPGRGLLGLVDFDRPGGHAQRPLSLQGNPTACEVPSILVIEPDPDRAGALTRMVHDAIEAKVIVSASADVAVAVMARRMPDLILLSALTHPGDERSIIDFLRQANRRVPVLIVSPFDAPRLERTTPSSGLWRSRRRSESPRDLARDALAARMRGALEPSQEHDETGARGVLDLARSVTCAAGVSVPRAHRWPAGDVSWLSGVKLTSGVAGRVVNISNSGLLVVSEAALMPGSSVTFELCRQTGDTPQFWRPDFDLMVPAHVVRSEVSKIGTDRLQYLVAARFSRQLELLADCPAVDGTAGAAQAILPEPPRSTAGDGLHDLARALEKLQLAVARVCPPDGRRRGPRTH